MDHRAIDKRPHELPDRLLKSGFEPCSGEASRLLPAGANSVSPAPCEEGVFYRFASACQAVVGDALHPVHVSADRPSLPAEMAANRALSEPCKTSGAHSTERAVIVNRNVSKVNRKTPCRTITSATSTACNVCPSPAADAYFTAFPGGVQAPTEKNVVQLHDRGHGPVGEHVASCAFRSPAGP